MHTVPPFGASPSVQSGRPATIAETNSLREGGNTPFSDRAGEFPLHWGHRLTPEERRRRQKYFPWRAKLSRIGLDLSFDRRGDYHAGWEHVGPPLGLAPLTSACSMSALRRSNPCEDAALVPDADGVLPPAKSEKYSVIGCCDEVLCPLCGAYGATRGSDRTCSLHEEIRADGVPHQYLVLRLPMSVSREVYADVLAGTGDLARAAIERGFADVRRLIRRVYGPSAASECSLRALPLLWDDGVQELMLVARVLVPLVGIFVDQASRTASAPVPLDLADKATVEREWDTITCSGPMRADVGRVLDVSGPIEARDHLQWVADELWIPSLWHAEIEARIDRVAWSPDLLRAIVAVEKLTGCGSEKRVKRVRPSGWLVSSVVGVALAQLAIVSQGRLNRIDKARKALGEAGCEFASAQAECTAAAQGQTPLTRGQLDRLAVAAAAAAAAEAENVAATAGLYTTNHAAEAAATIARCKELDTRIATGRIEFLIEEPGVVDEGVYRYLGGGIAENINTGVLRYVPWPVYSRDVEPVTAAGDEMIETRERWCRIARVHIPRLPSWGPQPRSWS